MSTDNRRTNDTSRLYREIKYFFKDRFNLSEDKALEIETINEIKRNVIFRGANLWILIFAILTASVGLNMNSTAVVIGAMLISPLMGPIMGIGLGAGINDFELIVQSLKNIGIAVIISVATSALYFFLTPLNDAQSELLSRTSPTIYDVLIASFGGLAGIVAGSRKEKSNAIPGVAIATALMPPLCTAGYGMANGNWDFFFGAMYLFFINSVFISIATYVIIRLMKYSKKEFMDINRERKVKRYIYIFALLTVLPSVYTAYKMVNKSVFNSHAQQFVDQEFNFDKTKVISKTFKYTGDENVIEVSLYGDWISEDVIESLNKKVASRFVNTELKVYQSGDNEIDEETIKSINSELKYNILEELYAKNDKLVNDKNDKIKLLEDELYGLKKGNLPHKQIAEELSTINKNVLFSSVSSTYINDDKGTTIDTIILAYIVSKDKLSESEKEVLKSFISTRTNNKKVKLFNEKS